MRHMQVFYCSNNHMIYADDYPDICKECGSMSFTAVYGVQVSVEDGDGATEKSEHYHSEE